MHVKMKIARARSCQADRSKHNRVKQDQIKQSQITATEERRLAMVKLCKSSGGNDTRVFSAVFISYDHMICQGKFKNEMAIERQIDPGIKCMQACQSFLGKVMVSVSSCE
jgi:hypothetical protein